MISGVTLVVHLGQLSLAGAAIVGGGIGLGTVMSAFVEPIPTEAPEPAWRAMLSTPIAAGNQDVNTAYYGSQPQDLSPPEPRFVQETTAAEAAWLAAAERDAQAVLVSADYPPRTLPDGGAELADRTVTIPHVRALEDAAGSDAPPAQDDGQPLDPKADAAVVVVPADLAEPSPPPAVRAKTIRIVTAEG